MRKLIILLLLPMLAGCDSTAGEEPLPVVRGPSGCSKVCQLIGDTDLETGRPTGNQTLARSDDEGLTFEYIADISTLGPFINLSVEVVDNASWPGLPESSGQGLLIWGSGEFRLSSVSLAFQPLDQIEDPSSIRYYAGPDSWSSNESDAVPLFEET